MRPRHSLVAIDRHYLTRVFHTALLLCFSYRIVFVAASFCSRFVYTYMLCAGARPILSGTRCNLIMWGRMRPPTAVKRAVSRATAAAAAAAATPADGECEKEHGKENGK